MICGFCDKGGEEARLDEYLRRMLPDKSVHGADLQLSRSVALASVGSGIQADSGEKAPLAIEQGILGVWKGEIYNRSDLLHALDLPLYASQNLSDREIFLGVYQAFGPSCVEMINGQFAFAVYNQKEQELVLGRDRLGLETLYYYDDSKVFVFSSKISPILAHPSVRRELNPQALRRFLAYCYNPAWDTFFCGIKKVRPGSLIILNAKGVTHKRYWFLSFREVQERPLSEYCEEIRELTKDSVRRRIPESAPLGIFLSGGMDSSSVAGLTRDLVNRPLKTFSYRCLGKSVDESHYARIMAGFCASEHQEVLYKPEDVCQTASMVELMDEPFCNIGVNIATYLLAEAAKGKVTRVFSGDGGDELFGGHPVYVADKMAAMFEKVPYLLRSPLTALLRRLPDSDQKQNLTVKLKRFSESIAYPKELGTHRWRVYYTSSELEKLLQPGFFNPAGPADSLSADLASLAQEADGPDMLSRSLYVDFQTELGFSIRRMDLLRHFQITPCFPLLDHRLVEYAATIPSHLKIRGHSETKYIQHLAMEPVLPLEIVHRKDKLGHSIPFKTWLRSNSAVKGLVEDVLSESSIKKRGLFKYEYVRGLWQDHQARRRNNSHRLRALTVLELWMTANGF